MITTKKQVFIVTGGTSFFSVGCLIPTLQGIFGEDISITLNIRSESKNKVILLNALEKNTSVILNYDMSEEKITRECKISDYIFYLSSHYNHDILRIITNESYGNVCIFGSAIIYSDDDNIKQTTYYQEKRAIMNFSKDRKVIFLVPGHFLQNIHVPDWTPKGLHSDTLQKLLKQDETLTSKFYNVTPLNILVNFCVGLVKGGGDLEIIVNKFKNGKPLCIMTQNLFDRKSLFDENLTIKHSNFPIKGLKIKDEDVISAINEIKRINLF
jgi:hypothetical protein